jgi:colanic acid biosynthesis glycosyl transferase WcaI
MRVLIITHVYPPEHAPAGIMAAELAEDLTQAGHGVMVLTGYPSHPSGRLFPGWKARFLSRERTDAGFTVLRCIHSFVPRFRLLAKMWYYFTFALSSFWAGLLRTRCDVLIMQSTPIFGVFTAVLLGKIKRARVFYWMHDVHPESALNAGVLKVGFLARLMRAMDTWVCRRCDVVAVPTEEMRQIVLQRRLSAARVTVQRHWIDQSRIRPTSRQNAWRQKQAIPADAFVVLYAGTIGYISGATVVIEAANLLRDHPSILWLFVGDGPLRSVLEEQAKEYSLRNVKFLPFQPEADLNLMQATADVCLVTLKPFSGSTSIPSKIHGYTSAGRPVITSVDPGSSVAELVNRGGFGWVVPPADGRVLGDAVLHATADPAECRCRGEKAREFFEREFSRKAVTQEFRGKLELLYPDKSAALAAVGITKA